MKPGYINIKRLLWAFTLLLFASNIQAQTEVTAPMTGTPAAGEYYSKTKITLSAGFHFLPSAGQRFHAYILDGSCQPLTNSFSPNQNYIATSIPHSPMTSFTISGKTSCDVMQTVQYIDGLGRPLQTVQVKGSTQGQDIVQPMAYDQFGREAIKYQPYAAATADGSYKPGALTDVVNYYNPGGNGVSGNQQSNGIVVNPQPFAITNFESSPLNRVIEQGAPGTDWQPSAGHTNKIEYTTNNTTILTDINNSYLAVLYTASINPNQSRTLVRGNSQGTSYTAGQLYVTVSKDENWIPANTKLGTTEEYKDKEGHVVLKRTFNMSNGSLQILSTYYVYDDLGNLAFVLPPKTSADSFQPNQTILDNLCYQYRYDERNRLSQKKIPGKGWEYTVYNKLDQVVFTQDSLQKVKNQYSFVKYDGIGRVIMTGLVNNDTKTPATVQSIVNGQTVQLWEDRSSDTYGYSSNSYPKTNTGSVDVVPLTINYYDDYTGIPGIPAAYLTVGTNTLSKPTGLLTATSTAVLNTPADMLWTVNHYDDLGRAVKTYDQHYLGGIVNAGNYDLINTTYNFNNQPTTTTRQHFTTASITVPKLTIVNEYLYDHMGRKTKTWEQITNGNNTPDPLTNTLISKTEYNEIGQVQTKRLHSTDSVTFRQDIAYRYNERGWLRSSTSQLFEEELQYNTTVTQNNITPIAQYNGNIASQSWGTLAAPNAKTYGYKYDQLNRLTDGLSSANFNNNERNITYDLMGNMLTLERTTGGVLTDQLAYTYSPTSNNLLNVNDQSNNATGQKGGITNYKFDGNGNLVADDSKGITNIAYNLLNLPQTITGKNTTYVYDATGQKLRRIIGTATTDYVSGIQYEGITGTPPVLSFIQTEEGRALPKDATAYNYEYSLTDHLGNSRVTFDSFGAAATAKQTDDYYPFGMDIASGTRVSPVNNYLYNKKELQEDLRLYDYGARFYDPVIARWTSVDPLVEVDQESTSPYGYVYDDPIKNTDPDGRYPDGPDDDFVGGVEEGFTGYFTGLAHAVMNPGETIRNSFSADNLKDHLLNVATMGTYGIAKGTYNLTVAAVKGDTKTLGNAVGGKVAEGVTVLATDGALKGFNAVKGLVKDAVKAGDVKITEPYKRPNNATTKEQRASVQGKPCVTCGATSGKRVANHVKELVKEYYETGKIDKKKMRDVNSVNSQCTTCSAKQGAETSKYSKAQKKKYGL